jgi:hypothetical protein
MDLCGPQRSPSWRRRTVDGLALAVLVAAVFCAESLDNARATLAEAAAVAKPPHFALVWTLVALAGGLAGAYVACRLVRIAGGFELGPRRHSLVRTGHRLLPWWAAGALTAWLAWQAVRILELSATAGTVLHWVAIALAVITAWAGGAAIGDIGFAWDRAAVIRVQLVFLAALFFVVFRAPFTSAQLNDVLRAWGDGPASRPLGGIAAALLLGATVRASSSRLLRAYRPLRGTVPIWALTIAIAIAAFLAYIGMWGAAALVFGVATLGRASRPADVSAPASAEEPTLLQLSGTLGVVPLTILVVGLVGATTDSLLLPGDASAGDLELLRWTIGTVILLGLLCARAQARGKLDLPVPGWVLGILALAFGLGFAWTPIPAAALLLVLGLLLGFKAFGERGKHELWAAWGIAIGTGIAVYADQLGSARGLGAFAAALIGATGLLAALHLVGSAGVRRTMRRGGRVPVVLALALWIGVAWLMQPARSHQVRTTDARGTRVTLDRAVSDWLDQQEPVGGAVPMLLVAASGGGAKAAYWTDLVLDCMAGEGTPPRTGYECPRSADATARLNRVLLTSSVSGGSIGVLHFVRHRGELEHGTQWVNDAAGTEVLSPLVSWGLFHDLPQFLLGFAADPSDCTNRLGCLRDADRALVQEAAIAAGDDPARIDEGLLAVKGPLTVFNSSDAYQDPERVVLAQAALAPTRRGGSCLRGSGEPLRASIDARDLLGARDVPLVTAALLSARFPVLEPGGRVGDNAAVAGRCPGEASPALELHDGGLFENTGLQTVADLLGPIQGSIRAWKRTHPARANLNVQPIVLSIDDDVNGVKADDEYNGGIDGFGHPAERSAAVRKQFHGCAFPGVTYLRISPAPHVGAQAATGWELSRTSRRDDLGESLRTGPARGKLESLRRLLDGEQPAPGC